MALFGKLRKILFMYASNNELKYYKEIKVWEAFWVNPCLPEWFLHVILEYFVKFLLIKYDLMMISQYKLFK